MVTLGLRNWVNGIFHAFYRFVQILARRFQRLLGGRGEERSSPSVSISKLVLYPIKSCGLGISVSQWPIDKFGLELDRFWILVNDSTGASANSTPCRKVTQRECPKLVAVDVAVVIGDGSWPSSSSKSNQANSGCRDKNLYSAKSGKLVITAPGMQHPLEVPFKRNNPTTNTARVDVWGSIVDGFDEGDTAADWFSEYLGVRVRLLVKNPDTARSLKDRHTPPEKMLTYEAQVPHGGYKNILVSLELLQLTLCSFLDCFCGWLPVSLDF